MSSPLFKVSMQGTQVTHRRQPQEPWAGFQFWVWPYAWRKTATNVTVVSRGGRTESPASAPAAPPEPEPPARAPAAANPAASPAAPREGVTEDGSAPVYEQPVRPVMDAGDVPVQDFRGSRGSLVWKIPSRNRGGQE